MLGGCESDSASSHPEDRPERTYTGLRRQKVAVMVWTDLRIRAEYGRIQLDLARLVQEEVAALFAANQDKKEAAPAVEFVDAASVVRFQREHPEIDGAPIVDVAPRLGASRVVYIEIEEFSAQSPTSIMILKGNARATLRVLEVANRQAHVAFEEAGIKATFPPNAKEGVVPNDKINVRTIYQGTLRELAQILVLRFAEKV